MSLSQPTMFLISGPSAAGKSTVARLLAKRFSRGVHLEGDVFRRSIVTGREDPLPTASPDAESQLRLRYEIAVGAADRYFAEGFSVVVEDVIAGPLLAECVALVQSRPLHTVVLLPAANVIAARDAARNQSGYAVWSVRGFTISLPCRRRASGFGSTIRAKRRRRLWTRSSDAQRRSIHQCCSALRRPL